MNPPSVADHTVADLAALVRRMVLADMPALIHEQVQQVVHEEAHKKKQLELALRRGYFKEDSRLKDAELQKYLREPVDMRLGSTPFLGKMGERLLSLAGITTTPQLFAKFLELRTAEDSWEQHCTKFWHFLEQHGISASHRSTIVHAVSEKMAMFMPVLKQHQVDVSASRAPASIVVPPQQLSKQKTQKKRVVLILPDEVAETAAV